MKMQTVRTHTMTLGPFLTLILNSRPRFRSANENASKVCDCAGTSPTAILLQEMATSEMQTGDVAGRTLGPFVSLILRLVEQKAEVRRQSAPVKKHSEQPICFRFSC